MTEMGSAMTDDQRKAVVIDYLRAFDNGGVSATGGSIVDMFAEDASVFFPKWGIATGREEIASMFKDVGRTLKSIRHHYATLNWVFSGDGVVVCEGTSDGEHRDGKWSAGTPPWGAGNWCDVFHIQHSKIQRVYVYLDPDYAGRDTTRYPWLSGK
jgi:ketosteroid isomerase-like protein